MLHSENLIYPEIFINEEEFKSNEHIDFQWLEFDLNEKNICYLDKFKKNNPSISHSAALSLNVCEAYEFQETKKKGTPFQKNVLNQVANNLLARITRFGDVGVKLSKKSGAVEQAVYQSMMMKYYDSNDPFIDDSEVGEIKELSLIDSNFDDYLCVMGDLGVLAKHKQIWERKQQSKQQQQQQQSKQQSSSKNGKRQKIALNSRMKQNEVGIYILDRSDGMTGNEKYEICGIVTSVSEGVMRVSLDKRFGRGECISVMQDEELYRGVTDEEWGELMRVIKRSDRPKSSQQQQSKKQTKK